MIDISQIKAKYGKNILKFILGGLTVPLLSAGWIKDIFGTDDWQEIGQKILHPSQWLDEFTIYTIAFFTFRFGPARFTQRKWPIRWFYFGCYYLILLWLIRKLVVG